jgi:hypothetical protein
MSEKRRLEPFGTLGQAQQKSYWISGMRPLGFIGDAFVWGDPPDPSQGAGAASPLFVALRARIGAILRHP